MKKSIAIIGGGSSALMLAAVLDDAKYEVSIYEKNAAMGRKFLVAGEGGLNLTHSEDLSLFSTRYIPTAFFAPILREWNNNDLREWFHPLGIPTFIGSSKRVFPEEGIKPIEVLNKILELLKSKKVNFRTKHVWDGWMDQNLSFRHGQEQIIVSADIVVFALGGASWKVTGSDGKWTEFLTEKKILLQPFQPSNCTFLINWEKEILNNAEGKALKNIELRCGDKAKKGEVVITSAGFEGGAIYALSAAIRKELKEFHKATLFIDLKPSLSQLEIHNRISTKRSRSMTEQLKKMLNFSEIHLILLKTLLNKNEYTNPEILAGRIKSLPVLIEGTGDIDEAISTTGGIDLSEIDSNFMINKLPGHYAIGEMLDWDAPTGGYLLQACFSMGHKLANHLNSLPVKQ